ncbi:tripartite motif-containing protein 55-like [Salvelinus fontinalis]|uniref:tripartite motif-containing protein 55-like n=1 Tax=Salvelinus fontinalis TaxID=8038 RepID=UPI0024852C51|nr:tripartite motif-containing protein 55-like [Salvelinus fontinalis]
MCVVACVQENGRRQKSQVCVVACVQENGRRQKSQVCVVACVQENGRRQKSQVCEKLDHLYTILEERKRDLSLKLEAEQEEKLNYIRGLTKKYREHLERSCRTVETGIQTMEEPEMAVFLQVTDTNTLPQHSGLNPDLSFTLQKTSLKRLGRRRAPPTWIKVERGYEAMDHYTVNSWREGRALGNIDFISGFPNWQAEKD